MGRRIINIVQQIWGSQPTGWRTLLSGLTLTAALLMMPTRFEDAVIYQNADKVMAVVLEVDNSAVRETGLICSGEQVCSVLLKGGQFQGETVEAVNLLSGSISQDKQFAAGDRALVVVSHTGSAVTSVTMIDHFRIGWEALLAVIFTLLLILFAGSAGLRAMLTFLITVLCLWKVMIPYCLKGGNAVLGGLVVVTALTAVIILSVYGFDRRSVAAISGSMLGVVTACVLVQLCINSRVNITCYPRPLHTFKARRRVHYAVALKAHR